MAVEALAIDVERVVARESRPLSNSAPRCPAGSPSALTVTDLLDALLGLSRLLPELTRPSYSRSPYESATTRALRAVRRGDGNRSARPAPDEVGGVRADDHAASPLPPFSSFFDDHQLHVVLLEARLEELVRLR